MSNMLYWVWHFLLLTESDELSSQPFVNLNAFDIWGRRHLSFYFSSSILDILFGSCWTEPLALLLCSSPGPFLPSWPKEQFSPLEKYYLLLISCAWQNTWMWLEANVLCKRNLLLLKKWAQRPQRWRKGAPVEIWMSIVWEILLFFPFQSHFEQSKGASI